MKEKNLKARLSLAYDKRTAVDRDNYDFDVTIDTPEIVDDFATDEVSKRVGHDMRTAAEINKEESRKGNEINKTHNPGLDYILTKAPQIAEWRQLIAISPSLALEPFYFPGDHLLRPAVRVERSAHEWLTDQQLGVALRNRMKMKRKILVNLFREATIGDGNRSPETLVLAGGRGRVPIMAAIESERATGVAPNLTVVDIDRNALGYAEIIARDSGFTNLRIIDRDIMQTDGFATEKFVDILKRSFLKGRMAKICAQRLTSESYDITTAIGIKMYIPDDIWRLQYRKKIYGHEIIGEVKKIGSIGLLKNMHEHTKSGGAMLFDAINPNMTAGRFGKSDGDEDGERFVQLEITDMMGWDRLQTSTEKENLNLIQKAGIGVRDVRIIRDPSVFFSLYLLRKR